MTDLEITPISIAPVSQDRHRLLGMLGMIGGPMLLASIVLAKLGYIQYLSRADSALGLAYIGGWICSALGLRRLGVLGTGKSGKVLFLAQLAGLLLAALWCIVLLVAPGANTGNNPLSRVADMAWPLSHLYMLVIGVAVLKAGVWTGWRRFVPLVCGFALITALGVGEFAGRRAMELTFGVYTAIAWMLLGYAVRTGEQLRLNPLQGWPSEWQTPWPSRSSC